MFASDVTQALLAEAVPYSHIQDKIAEAMANGQADTDYGVRIINTNSGMPAEYRCERIETMTTPDEVITAVTEAPTTDDALRVIGEVRSRALLLATADQLYIDVEGRASATIRRAIVEEARSLCAPSNPGGMS